MVDVYRPIDVVEEILRIYGYDNIDLPMHMKMSESYGKTFSSFRIRLTSCQPFCRDNE